MLLFFLVVSSSVLAFWLFALVFYLIDHTILSKQRRLRAINKHQKIEMYVELEKSFYDRFVSPILKKFSVLFVRMLPKKSTKSTTKNKRLELIEKQLHYAGLNISATDFLIMRNLIAGITGGLLSGTMGLLRQYFGSSALITVFAGVVGALSSFVSPSYFLKSRISSRSQKIRQQLPEVMDLLSVSIEAGLGFDGALIKISETISGPLVDELMILNRDINMGCPRSLALRNFGECCDVKELKVFASSLAQAEQLGIPIKNVLNTQAAQIRMSRRQKAQEKGMKAPVKIMLPMVVFIFPVIFIILLGPTVMNIINQFMK